MIYMIIFVAILFAITCGLVSAVFRLEDKLTSTECKVYKLEELREQEVSSLSSQIASIMKELEDRKTEPKETGDVIEDQLNEAREKVFSEWIQNIVNYDPLGGK